MKKFLIKVSIALLTLILLVPTVSYAKQTDYSYLGNSNTNKIIQKTNGDIKVSLKKKSKQYGYVVIEHGKNNIRAYQIPLGKEVVLPLPYGKGKYRIIMGHSKSQKMDVEFVIAKQRTINIKKINEKRYVSQNFIVLKKQSPQIDKLLKTEFKGWNKWSDTKKVKEVTKYFEKWYYNDNLADYVDDHWYTPYYAVRIKNKNGICYDTAAITASLLRSMNVPTKFIGGYWKGNRDTYHAWNEVKINGKWKVVDNTFNMKAKVEDGWFYPDEPVFEKAKDYIKQEEY